ncbi:MAG TPA: CheR family methyltransferase [Blastocatellia bacterium]|nr:CheR family methyltransferase [Blastocatellia bacterium]
MTDKNPNTKLEDLEIELLLEGVVRYYGYDFRGYEPGAIKRRIKEAMLRARVPTVSRFQERLLHDPAFLERFLRSLSNRRLSMFSDPSFYHAFRSRVVPVLKTYPFIRIWHLGCSTGQEVYSMAILLAEEGIYGRSRMYATDLSGETVEEARKGSFPVSAIEEYASNYLNAGGKGSFLDNFKQSHNRLVIRPSLRKSIVFSEHNLATDGSFNEFQVIVCRDVLTSFSKTLRERVDSLIYDSLGRFGILALGSTESLESMPHEACYELLDHRGRFYRKTGYGAGQACMS